MYDTFFEHIKPKEVESLEVLTRELETRPEYITENVDPPSITLGDDGLVNYNGRKAKMSLEGFRNMVVKLYGIPDPAGPRNQDSFYLNHGSAGGRRTLRTASTGRCRQPYCR